MLPKLSCCLSRRWDQHAYLDSDDLSLPPRTVPAVIALANLHSCSTQTNKAQNHQDGSVGGDGSRFGHTLAHGAITAPLEPGHLDEDGYGSKEDIPSLGSKAAAALEAVKSKLIRHLSHENNMRQRSFASIGSSDEEVARRAELKRAMRRRIQEQLNEDSIRSSSKASAQRSNCSSHLIDAAGEGSGPRDKVEFDVFQDFKASHLGDQPTVTSTSEDILTTNDTLDPSDRHDGCIVISTENDSKGCSSKCQTGPATRGATSPKIGGRGRCSMSQRSAHFSARSSLRQDFLHDDDEQSTLEVWLMAQGLRSSDSSPARVGTPIDETTYVADHHEVPSEAKEDVMEDTQMTAPTEVDDLEGPLASWQCWTGGNSGRGVFEDHFSLNSATDNGAIRAFGRISVPDVEVSQNSPEDLAERSLEAASDSSSTGNSSRYPSGLSSFQPSPVRSRPNIHALSAEDLETLQLSPFQCKVLSSLCILSNLMTP